MVQFACDRNLEGITELSLLEKVRSIGEKQGLSEINMIKINIVWVKRWKKRLQAAQRKQAKRA